jgi:hypothetical protein
VPVCLSASHIAFGSIRMEPVFMILGQSAATAAAMAMDSGIPVQQVNYERLEARLLADGQILEWGHPDRIHIGSLRGIVIDDVDAQRVGAWGHSGSVGPYVGHGYLHDNNENKGQMSVGYAAALEPGRYEVRISYSPNPNRATNVPVTVHHAAGESTIRVNQRRPPALDNAFVSLGTFAFDNRAVVVIANDDTDGHVIADAVQFLPE